ncbi:MAG: DNA translocase FtsK [Candidatus Dormibacteria bacterium]
MARRAPTRPLRRSRTSPRPQPPRSTKRRRPSPPRPPLLTSDQQREITGVALLGTGVVLGIILALPGGGAIAAPIQDWGFHVFGLGAWGAAVALILTGSRICGRSAWTGGILGALGSTIAVVAGLALLGLLLPGSAGIVGQHLGNGVGRLLGTPAAAMAAIVLACVGLVLAVDLRVGPVAAAARTLLARWAGSIPRPASGPVKLEKVERLPRAPRGEDAVVELTGTPVEQASLFPELPLVLGEPDSGAETPGDEEIPGAFAREFEGSVEVPKLGAVPDVALPHAEGLDEVEKVWVLPTTDLLDTVSGKRERLNHEVDATGRTIVNTLASFGIQVRLVGHSSGPTVTQYELQPAAGVPVRKIVNCQTDLSLALAAPVRIQPFIPGKSAVGIEVPNKAAQLVSLKEVVSASAFADPRTKLSVALGADVSGHPVIGDLTRMPHMLVAGSTGSGKSVCINAVLAGFLLQATPAQLKLILIDPKRVELSNFADIPHLLVPVVVEPEAAVASLRWAVKEMEERYKLFASHGARNIAAFNERAPSLGLSPLPYTVIVIDELADLMMVAAGEIEDLICRIAQLARAVGIHLVVATQRPSADIITGLIKANIPSRVAFAVSSGVDSRVILDEMGAEKLLGRGDMLYLPIEEGKPRRLQGAFCSDRELDSLIEHWKAQGKPDYQEEIFLVEATVSWADKASKRDPLFAKAAHCVAAEGRAAASLLQRKLSIGYTRAARLVDQLAEHRVVGPYEGSKSRDVLMDVLQVDELIAELGDE